MVYAAPNLPTQQSPKEAKSREARSIRPTWATASSRATVEPNGIGTALLKIGRPRAAIYLTGYAVECILKAMLLVHTPAGARAEMLATFRGAIAHNIEWLRDRLVQRIGRLPVGENRQVSLVSSWSTDLRYEPGPGEIDDAKAFLSAAESILAWANGRM
jgi:hypothetical protein